MCRVLARGAGTAVCRISRRRFIEAEAWEFAEPGHRHFDLDLGRHLFGFARLTPRRARPSIRQALNDLTNLGNGRTLSLCSFQVPLMHEGMTKSLAPSRRIASCNATCSQSSRPTRLALADVPSAGEETPLVDSEASEGGFDLERWCVGIEGDHSAVAGDVDRLVLPNTMFKKKIVVLEPVSRRPRRVSQGKHVVVGPGLVREARVPINLGIPAGANRRLGQGVVHAVEIHHDHEIAPARLGVGFDQIEIRVPTDGESMRPAWVAIPEPSARNQLEIHRRRDRPDLVRRSVITVRLDHDPVSAFEIGEGGIDSTQLRTDDVLAVPRESDDGHFRVFDRYMVAQRPITSCWNGTLEWTIESRLPLKR